MPKMAKDVANASQKQKYVFSLPSDVLADVLRYFSRKELCQQIYAVNRQFFHLAISRQQVPTIHVIDQLHFRRSERRPLLRKSSVKIGSDSTISSCQFKAISPPGPFIRFRYVFVWRFLGEKTLRILRQTKESFIGSVIKLCFTNDKRMITQMHYLLQSIFNDPSSWVTMSGGYLQFSEFIKRGGTLPNYNKTKFYLYRTSNCKQKNVPNVDTIRVLLKWIIGDNNLASGSVQGNNSKKHLILENFPRKLILDLVQQIKEAFESNNSLLSDFVITFVECAEEIYCCLKGDHEFSLDKISTGERLSFFKHFEHGEFREIWNFDFIPDTAYRLWYRKVTSDAQDSTMLSYLRNIVEPDSDFKDSKFYAFEYPQYWNGF